MKQCAGRHHNASPSLELTTWSPAMSESDDFDDDYGQNDDYEKDEGNDYYHYGEEDKEQPGQPYNIFHPIVFTQKNCNIATGDKYCT